MLWVTSTLKLMDSKFFENRGFVFKSTDGGDQFELVGDFANLTRWLFFTNSEDTKELLVTTGLFDREPDTAVEKEYEELSDDAIPSGLWSRSLYIK